MIAMMAVIVSPVLALKTGPDCDQEALQELWRRFNDCTGQYKEKYNASLTLLENKEEEERGERTRITCQLVDSLVEICTGIWSSCYPDHRVADMKERFVENLRGNNERASISIELCGSIRNMK